MKVILNVFVYEEIKISWEMSKEFDFPFNPGVGTSLVLEDGEFRIFDTTYYQSSNTFLCLANVIDRTSLGVEDPDYWKNKGWEVENVRKAKVIP